MIKMLGSIQFLGLARQFTKRIKGPNGLKFPSHNDYFAQHFLQDKNYDMPKTRKGTIDSLRDMMQQRLYTQESDIPEETNKNLKNKEKLQSPKVTQDAEIHEQERFNSEAKKKMGVAEKAATKQAMFNLMRGNVALKSSAKEAIYRDYMAGMTLRDVCVKYGVMGDRAKAIIYGRHQYWTVIYPQYGEKHKRDVEKFVDLMEKKDGISNNQTFFVDMNIDTMYKKPIAKISPPLLKRSMADKLLDENQSHQYRELFSKYVHKKEFMTVPLKMIGSGPRGYLLKNMFIHNGKGKRDADLKFRKKAEKCVNQLLDVVYPEI